MSYEKPKCDCGELLDYTIDTIYHKRFKVTKKGLPFKKMYDFQELDEEFREKLDCGNCDKYYEVTYDENGRILRGSLWIN